MIVVCCICDNLFEDFGIMGCKQLFWIQCCPLSRMCVSTLCFKFNRYGHFANCCPDTDSQPTGKGVTGTAGTHGRGSTDNVGDE